jgi:disulfide bond formation protein DsbB
MMQRYAALSFAFICVIGQLLTTLRRVKWAMMFQMGFALVGLFFASRQLWLQFFLKGQPHACLPDIHVLIHYFPWKDVFTALFWGAGDCSDTTLKLFGLPMSVWAAVYFLFTFLMSVYLYFRLVRLLEEFSSK